MSEYLGNETRSAAVINGRAEITRARIGNAKRVSEVNAREQWAC